MSFRETTRLGTKGKHPEGAEHSPEVHSGNLCCLLVAMCIWEDLSKQGPLASGAMEAWVHASLRNS